ncbi:hypothetical protein M378DRAFT_12339 [Amanita muscaria Koide BX008]|uniref:Uncharacterized protein n=1 Tax=Amanita muscaria (strain Koide BX008) TaxID=946122 RepID=A0A0C2X1U5_AMAMK|nr:hypothetical protein M378DRAFT_12339 [Amanita muscaria Koide BX008]
MANDFNEVIITGVASADALQIHEPPPSLLSMPPTSINTPGTSHVNAANPFSLSADKRSDPVLPRTKRIFPLTPVSLPSPKPSSSTLRSWRLWHDSYSSHGYSSHALLHLKCFWAVRQMGQRRCPNWAWPAAKVNTAQSGPQAENSTAKFNVAPMSVQPRRGNIAGFRDPYSLHIDRCFVNMPSWTLVKTMYMFGMRVGYDSRVTAMSKWKRCDDNVGISQGAETHKKSGTEARRKKEPSTDTQDQISGTLASIASSDDSDATLIESENGKITISGAGSSSPSSSSENSFTTLRFKCVFITCPTEKSSSK